MSKLKLTSLATADDAYSVPTETLARGACRAWVNFDGSTTPPTIRTSFNVSSVVRNATGVYEVNFTEPLIDPNCVCLGGVPGSVSALNEPAPPVRTNSSIVIRHSNTSNGTLSNTSVANMAIHR